MFSGLACSGLRVYSCTLAWRREEIRHENEQTKQAIDERKHPGLGVKKEQIIGPAGNKITRVRVLAAERAELFFPEGQRAGDAQYGLHHDAADGQQHQQKQVVH